MEFKNVSQVDEEVLLERPSQPETVDPKDVCIESQANWISRLSFMWASSLVSLGYKRPLTDDDLGSASPSLKTGPNYEEFNRIYYGVESGDLGLPKRSLLSAIMIFTWTWQVQAFLLRGLGVVAHVVSPLILKYILQIVSELLHLPDGEQDVNFLGLTDPVTDGIILCVALLVANMVKSITWQGQYWNGLKDGIKCRNVLMLAVYRKTLLLSSAGRQSSTVGQMTNLVSMDANAVFSWMWHSSELALSVMAIIASHFILATLVGWKVALVTAALTTGTIPLNAFLARMYIRVNTDITKKSDVRIGSTNQLLQSIRFVKLYNWEDVIRNKVSDARDEEIKVLKKIVLIRVIGNMLWSVTPAVISLAIFFIYTYFNGVVTAPLAFAIIALIQSMREPLGNITMATAEAVAAFISVGRLDKFFNLEEIDIVDQIPDLECSIKIKDGNFSWDLNQATPTIQNINISIRHRRLVGVVGPVGSGKTSLCAAILGQIKKVSGSISMSGRTLYTSQQAWILNATFRDNILFGKEFDQERYEKVVKVCSLVDDLKQFPAGDQTELGERGINLSGGQKQRLSLARAVYQDADIYVLDEPLGAVDTTVAKTIFRECIQKFLKEKTVILITHQLQFLPMMDEVIVMDEGCIKHQGNFQELLNSGVDLSSILQLHSERLMDVQKNSEEVPESGVSEKLEEKKPDSEISGKIISKEERGTGAVKSGVYLGFFRSFPGGLFFLGISILCFFLAQGTRMVGDYSLALWAYANEVSNMSENSERSRYYLEIYTLWFGIQMIFTAIREILLAFTVLKCSKSLHDMMLKSVLRAKMAFFDATPTGRIINRFAKDLEVLDRQVYVTLTDMTFCGISVIFTFVAICIFSPPLIPLILVTCVVYWFVQRYYLRSCRELKRMESLSRSPIYHNYSECVNGASIISGYGNQKAFLESRFLPTIDYNTKLYYWHFAVNRWLAIRLDFATTIVVFFTSVYTVFFPSASSGLALSYTLGVSGAINWMVRQISQLEIDMNATERILEYTRLNSEAPEYVPENDSRHVTWPIKAGIRFDNLWFRYLKENEENFQVEDVNQYVLKGVACDIQPKEKIGIVGRTGAGKSSLVTALFRLTEYTKGDIVIDDVPISKLGLKKLRSNISIIPQDPILFNEKIRWNLDPAGVFPDSEIWRVLEEVNMKRVVSNLSEGLDTVIAENGDNFSVGQKQLICLARALLRNSKVLVLDEASASLDLETDEFIQKTIRNSFKDATVLTIAHRIHTIIDSDRIMVLDAGNLVEMDTPGNLMKNPASKFSQLVQDALSMNKPATATVTM